MRRLLVVIGAILLSAIVFVVANVVYGIGTATWDGWKGFAMGALFFAVIGAHYGTIVALDDRSTMAEIDRPLLRTFLCALFGALLVLLVQSWPPQNFHTGAVLIGATIGGVLGWWGWSWAKYVDF